MWGEREERYLQNESHRWGERLEELCHWKGEASRNLTSEEQTLNQINTVNAKIAEYSK